MIGVLPLVLAAQLCRPATGPAPVVSPWSESACAGQGASATGDGGYQPPFGPAAVDGTRVDRIEVRSSDIFDPALPGENRTLFRWANRLHRTTREDVVRSQLLIAPGDRYSQRLLDESERLLRAQPYLHDASIQAHPAGDGEDVDLEVRTRDVWTLNAGFSFGREGGTNSTSYKVEDVNFLGSGKAVYFKQSFDVDRSTLALRYRDPGLFGSRSRLDLGYQDSSDGAGWHLLAERPFFSLDSRWAAAVAASELDQVDSRYLRGRVSDRYRHQTNAFELSGGLSTGLHEGQANRWSAGLSYRRDQFSPAPDRPSLQTLPADRTLAYPWIEFEHVEDAFIEEVDLDRIGRTEDRFVGRHARARIGFSSSLSGGDGERLIYDGELGIARELAHQQLLDLSAHVSGRWGSAAEDVVVGAAAAFHRRDFGRHVFFASLRGDVAYRLDADHQLLLGGDSGLRGYPLRYQDGDRRVLLTLEQRFFSDWEPLHLAKVGGAVFCDVGRSWFADGRDGSPPGSGFLTDVGLGLRLGHTRSGHGSVVHVDLAFPLDRGDGISSPQWLVSSKASF